MFYLNGTEIEEPSGFSGVYWTRVRHPDYFGIWRHRTAKVMGIGEVGFDGQARELLNSLRKKYGVNASATFQVQEGSEVIYSGEIDFGIWSDNGRYFNASFRDEDTELDSLSSVVVDVEPEILITLPQQAISDGIVYKIGEGLQGPFRVNSSTHSIPLAAEKSGEGNGLSVTNPAGIEPIYRNSTERKSILTLEGKIICTWAGSGTLNITAEVNQDNVVKDSRIISILNTSSSPQTAFISESIEVPQGAYLRIIITGSSGLLVTYSLDSSLTIFENSDSTSSQIWGLTWKQAIEGMLQKLTLGTVQLSSAFLSKGRGASRVITSERNLRGYRSPVRMSLKSFWDDINAIENLACWKRGNTLFIESKADMVGKVGYSRIKDYETLIYSPSPFYAASYTVGYQNWQSGTAAGRDEFCTSRTYVTDQQKVKAGRSIIASNLSASGKTMELLRRNPNTDKADTGQDENLFVVAATRPGSNYIAITGNVENVILQDSAINADISPRQMLSNWMNVLGVNGKALFSSGTGNVQAKTNGMSENSDLTPPNKQIFSDQYATIETGMTMREYAEMGEVVEYYDHDGLLKSALVMEDSYRFSTGKTIIKAIELQ